MNIFLSFLDMFYPRLCLRCGRSLTQSEEFLCPHCIVDIPRTNFHLHPEENQAVQVFGGKIYVKEVFYFTKKGSYSNLIYSLKYKGRSELARYLGALYAMELKVDGKLKNIDYIVPVPLHKKRLKERGYNQSELIASGVAEKTGA
ncbi:MAG: ComF family protein, partial [Bacteroidales bacterium]